MHNDENLGAIRLKLGKELDALGRASALATEYPHAMQARLPGPRSQIIVARKREARRPRTCEAAGRRPYHLGQKYR